MFNDVDKIVLNDKKLELFLNGVKLETKLNDGICKVYNENGKFIGIAEIKLGKLKRDVIM